MKVVLEEFLGLAYRVEENEGAEVTRIEREDGAGKGVVVADELLAMDGADWLTANSLPKLPLRNYTPPSKLGFEENFSAPAIFAGKATAAQGDVTIDFDLFGSIFFLLTRYEEVVIDARDRFGRFQAKDTVMFKAGVLDRPLVDEYTEILRRSIEACWPGTKFKERKFKIVPSHDVDVPFEYLFMPAWRVMRRMAAQIVRQRSLRAAKETLRMWQKVRAGDDMADPQYTDLLRMMEMNEKAGLPGIFYFIAGHTSPYDLDYDIEHPRVRRLLRTIHARGHVIGLHPSFGTLGRVDLIREELKRLQRVCDEERISQDVWSVRSHYLRWESRRSFADFDAVGFDFDSTLSFAELAGFRCGTCHEYSTFDLASNRPLKLREQPLIAMECSVLQPYYQGLKFEEAAAFFAKLKERCRAMNGQYVFLWHNSSFPTPQDWELFEQQLN